MALELRDIIDLDFFLDLDDQGPEQDEATLALRDREIFGQIPSRGLSDAGLVKEWLFYRRLLFFHELSPDQILPGALFTSLLRWAARVLFLSGLGLGLAAAFAFLAYHGSRPINVTLFTAFFILLQILLCLLTLGLMARQMLAPSGRIPGAALFQRLLSGIFFSRLGKVYEKAAGLPGGSALKSVKDASALAGNLHRNHPGILFWPFIRLSSLLAVGFGCGALAALLFQVAATDLAFGWESTLISSAPFFHDLVSGLALPWSWALPEALPTLAQVEGSRIFLKEGIAGLATEDLTAWWPFLAMGILVYALGLRLVLLLAASRGQDKALTGLDLTRPRYRRLLVRMRSPNLETRAQETPVSPGDPRPPIPRPREDLDAQALPPAARPSPGKNPDSPRALVLASAQAFASAGKEEIIARVEAQLDLKVDRFVAVSFDLDQDRPLLEAAVRTQGPLLLVQEVWQPPIRGLLYYISQLKIQILNGRPVWILLTQTPGSQTLGVAADDMNYKVWKTAVAQLNDPDIVLERILP